MSGLTHRAQALGVETFKGRLSASTTDAKGPVVRRGRLCATPKDFLYVTSWDRTVWNNSLITAIESDDD